MSHNFADFFEAVARHQPDRVAQIHDDRVFTWREFEDRAARLANEMVSHGLKFDSKVGIYLQNCNEYMEATFAAFKMRAVPININYRYEFDELAYLVENADLEGFVFHARYARLVERLKERFPQLRLLTVVDDGSGEPASFARPYEEVIATSAPMAPIERSPEDIFMFYTGGTTGMPKGVMYHQGAYATAVMPPLAGYDIRPMDGLADLPRFLNDVEAAGATPRSMPLCPLMHLTAMGLGALISFSIGGSIVTMSGPALDARRIWDIVWRHDVTSVVIVGDTFARALLDEVKARAARGEAVKPPRLRGIVSSGAMWSREVKEELLSYLDVMLVDAMGSTEGGVGASVTTKAGIAGTGSFQAHSGVKVITDDGRILAPGSEESGRIAVSGNIPVGYYKDPEKTRRTFREIDGVRYSIAGDYAKVAEDGSIILLGRGSSCINTAGEKVFPEEVEETLKLHPAVQDAAVVGMPDPKYGQKVAAVVASAEGVATEEVLTFIRGRIAGYKVPKQIVVVDTAVRSPSGKMDYAWARSVLEAAVEMPA